MQPKDYPPFADDPFRGRHFSVLPEHISDLNSPVFLKTTLIDYIVRHVMPKDLPDDILVGSSNSIIFFNSYIDKKNKQNDKKTTTAAQKGLDESVHPDKTAVVLQNYRIYGHHRYRFLAPICDANHFFVISLVFDMNATDDPIHDVRVFDSRRTSRRRTRDKPSQFESAGKYLIAFQKFMAHFVAVTTKHSDLLTQDPTYVLRAAT